MVVVFSVHTCAPQLARNGGWVYDDDFSDFFLRTAIAKQAVDGVTLRIGQVLVVVNGISDFSLAIESEASHKH